MLTVPMGLPCKSIAISFATGSLVHMLLHMRKDIQVGGQSLPLLPLPVPPIQGELVATTTDVNGKHV